jgi:hypothetical protein
MLTIRQASKTRQQQQANKQTTAKTKHLFLLSSVVQLFHFFNIFQSEILEGWGRRNQT